MSMLVRRAILTDLNEVVRLCARGGHSAHMEEGVDSISGGGFQIEFLESKVHRLFRTHLHSSNALCLVLQVNQDLHDLGGLFMAQCSEHPFGPVRWAWETLWYVEPQYRKGHNSLKMLKAYENWARKMGCTYVDITALSSNPDVSVIYERMGYKAQEVHFLKRI